jgi:hypothetical protein
MRIDVERVMNWLAAFCVGYVIGVSIAALVVFYWRG